MHRFTVDTRTACELIDITKNIQGIVDSCGIADGLCCIFVPHTTAAVTINENADPDVQVDILQGLDAAVPLTAGYRHTEGNSAAHIKASLMGSSQTVVVEGGKIALGTWQSIFFCEFDGPRKRQIWIAFATALP